ncbi:MAG: Clp protease ClpP [Eggerthellaceae bacterium]|nr:Clp protease ClpP [Eggerthellaceae bacterium]
MTRIKVNGSIINSGDGWIYDWLRIPYTSPDTFKEQLAAAEDDVIVEINSPGGYVSAAAEIYEAIRSYHGNIECRVVGQAASAASVIACAARNSISPMGTFFMHNCIGSASGNHNDMRQTMKAMESIDESIMEAYRAKTGMTDAEIYALMEENTTLNARQAVEYGFIDKITDSAADIAQASSAVTGIAASAGGFVDLMAMDEMHLAAVREAYENSRQATGEGGEPMNLENIRDEETEETAETQAEESEAGEVVEAAEGETGETEGAEAEESQTEGVAEDSEPEGDEPETVDGETADEADDAQAAYERGVLAERERIAGILDIAAQVPDAMVRAALFEAPISAEELALSAMRAESATRAGYIEHARADVAASGSAKVAADVTDNAADESDVQNALVAKLNKRHEK